VIKWGVAPKIEEKWDQEINTKGKIVQRNTPLGVSSLKNKGWDSTNINFKWEGPRMWQKGFLNSVNS